MVASPRRHRPMATKDYNELLRAPGLGDFDVRVA
jgi:hypothetical protein